MNTFVIVSLAIVATLAMTCEAVCPNSYPSGNTGGGNTGSNGGNSGGGNTGSNGCKSGSCGNSGSGNTGSNGGSGSGSITTSQGAGAAAGKNVSVISETIQTPDGTSASIVNANAGEGAVAGGTGGSTIKN